MKLVSLFLLLVVATIGCHKAEEGPTSASGRVVDEATRQGVGGARVRLLRSGGGNVLSGGGTVALDTVTADAQGNYSVTFRAEKDYQYELQGFAPGYLTGSLDSQPLVRLTGGRKNRKDVPLRPEGYLRVRFLAPMPAPYSGVRLQKYPGSSVEVFTGVNGAAIRPVDTTIVVMYPGGRNNDVSWRVYPDGTSTSIYHVATVYFPARDTADFTIRF